MDYNTTRQRSTSRSLVVESEEEDDEEVEEWLLDQELAKEGLYRGALPFIL